MNHSSTLNTEAAAAYLGVSSSSLVKWRTACVGPRYVKAIRRVLYRKQDLDAWLDEHTKGPKSVAVEDRSAA